MNLAIQADKALLLVEEEEKYLSLACLIYSVYYKMLVKVGTVLIVVFFFVLYTFFSFS